MRLIKITGPIPSKKNCRITQRSTGRTFTSKKYTNWHKGAMLEVSSQYSGNQIEKTKLIRIIICYPDKRKRDLSNTVESIMDLLVDAGILKDDNYKVVPALNLSGEYVKNIFTAEVEIHI